MEFIADSAIAADKIHAYKTKEGVFLKAESQICFVFPTGSDIQYLDQNNQPIEL
ncbi:hypothetical protein [Paenibacillus thalictri]|uniref:hypothetical protein n=1 Tax=Paenibacillus thalictri TaxID=2527873 RepID=UPI0013EEF4FD|nr:hypothetical protein [Paenibacillus thalictri]